MLKKIPVTEVKLGMYLQELCGSWMDHPFWKSSFLLKDPADLKALQTSSIREVWIDASKGLDISGGAAKGEAEAAVDAVLHQADARSAPADLKIDPVSLEQEAVRAARLCAKAKDAVEAMFQEARMGRAVETEQMRPLVEQIADSVMRNPSALISLARLKVRDEYTYMHSVAVCALMIALARQLGIKDEALVQDVGLAGLLHDIGKATVPLEILNKPGRLSEDEFERIKDHPVAGHRILVESECRSKVALDVCLHHHEKVDGTGYPDKLGGEGISVFARMGAVCDVYDAITSNRPYKNGWDPAEAIRKMTEWSAGHFDPAIFQAFVKTIGIYPTGSLVLLQSGRLAVVLEQSRKSLLQPVVKAFYSTRSRVHIPPEILDLSKASVADKIVSRESAEKWGLSRLEELWCSVAV